MNSNLNICSNCSIMFREWLELKYQLFYKTWIFRKFHANIKARDAPLNIVRFYSNFFWIFFIVFGTKLESEKMIFRTFCVKDQPNGKPVQIRKNRRDVTEPRFLGNNSSKCILYKL